MNGLSRDKLRHIEIPFHLKRNSRYDYITGEDLIDGIEKAILDSSEFKNELKNLFERIVKE